MTYFGGSARKSVYGGVTTTNMIVELLETLGYDLITKPTVNKTISRIGIWHAEDKIQASSSDSSKVLYLIEAKDSTFSLPDEAAAYVVLLNSGDQQSEDYSNIHPSQLKSVLLVKRRSSTDTLAVLESDISNYMLSVEKFASTLDSLARFANNYQSLIDAAEAFFDQFIFLVDSKNYLVACSKHVTPSDFVSQALVKHRRHTEEILRLEPSGKPFMELWALQKGVQIFPPSDLVPVQLVTAAICIQDRYVGYLVLTCQEDMVTPGIRDLFSIVAQACITMAERKEPQIPQLFPDGPGLLAQLLREEPHDVSLLEHRAKDLDVPAQGYFVLIRATWNKSQARLVNSYAEEICRNNDLHQIATYQDGHLVVMCYEESLETLRCLIDSSIIRYPLSSAEGLMVSDLFNHIKEAYTAYRSFDVMEKYRQQVLLFSQLAGRKVPRVVFFRDVFPFYLSDPYHDASIMDFALAHMVTRYIEQADRELGTNDLQLLVEYLLSERHTKAIAERHHLHRNGVLYRLKRIQQSYNLNLDDCVNRFYIQACMTASMSLGDKTFEDMLTSKSDSAESASSDML